MCVKSCSAPCRPCPSTHSLIKQLYDGLASLKYPNGTPVCRIYKGSLATYGDPKTQGATIAFNLQRDDESIVSYSEVERYANDKGIYLLSGGLCNPGGIASHLHLAPWEFKRAYSAGHRCGHVTQIISGKPTGVVRASLGAMSTLGDVNALLSFMRNQYLLHTDVPVEEAPIVANDGQKAEDPKLVMLENAKTRERPISKDTIDSSITAIGDTSHQFPKRKSARFKTWFSPWLFRIRRHKAVNQSAG